MITGFNTDIKYEGVTYHVQTEDKGLDTPLILSLVYDRGTILASKRSPYEDLLAGKFDEKLLTERLQKQHSLICAAIRAGRIEDLKRMTMKDSAANQKSLVAQKEVKTVVSKEKVEVPVETKPEIKAEDKTEIVENKQPEVADKEQKSVEISENIKIPALSGISENVKAAEKIPSVKFPEKKETKINIPKRELPVAAKPDFIQSKAEKPASVRIIEQIEARTFIKVEEDVWDIPIEIIEEPIIEAVQIVEEEMILPAEAVEILTDSANNEPQNEGKLQVRLLDDTEFKGGERKTIEISVNRGNTSNGLGGAHVLTKILGSTFRPLIFHSKTDSNGIAVVHLQIPRFKTGRAAIVIKAMSEGEEIEVRRTISAN